MTYFRQRAPALLVCHRLGHMHPPFRQSRCAPGFVNASIRPPATWVHSHHLDDLSVFRCTAPTRDEILLLVGVASTRVWTDISHTTDERLRRTHAHVLAGVRFVYSICHPLSKKKCHAEIHNYFPGNANHGNIACLDS